jgi:hypothetical protein
MLVLLFHFSLGLLTGALFGVQTLLLIVVLLPLEALFGSIFGASIGLSGWLGAGMVLQLGYLGGAILRSALERFATVTGLRTSGRT